MNDNNSTQKTKDIILSCALELFALQGYDATSTRQITQKSSTNLSAISYHFGNKEGLYKAVFRYCFGFVEGIIDSAPDLPLEKITHYATQMGKLHQSKPYIARLFMLNVIDTKPFMASEITHYQAKMRGFFFSTLESGVKQGIFRADIDIASSAIALLGIVNFYFFIHSTKILPQDFANLSKSYAQNALDIFLNGIRAR